MRPSRTADESIESVAARLLNGCGIATMCVRGSSDPADALTVSAHRFEDGKLAMTGYPAPGTTLHRPDSCGRSAAVMIDEFAPALEARVHVASLHTRGTIANVEQDSAGATVLEVELGDLAVSRLGRSGVVAVAAINGSSADPVAADTAAVAELLRRHYGLRIALLCDVRPAAAVPLVLGVDSGGLHLLVGVDTRADSRIVRVPFRHRVRCADDAVREVGRLIEEAA